MGRPAPNRLDPRCQFPRTDRLGDEVVRAGFQAGDAAGFAVLLAENDDPACREIADPANQRKPVAGGCGKPDDKDIYIIYTFYHAGIDHGSFR
ncbi:MAG: hypothetical protein HLUCCA12_05900 [Rhodobacteraceae bacterium HLUCCA12]|nr:MAG: hypothetical protein HLUCCA12_05900 [Rhodobacteraceae bacterium HLUCCA12]